MLYSNNHFTVNSSGSGSGSAGSLPFSEYHTNEIQPVNLKEQRVRDNVTLTQIDDGDGSIDPRDIRDPRDKKGIFNEPPSPQSKTDESNEFKTIRTNNNKGVLERNGSKELNIKM